MQTFFTLNTLIDDILLTIRNNDVSESEDLSRKQIELWIHYYRAMLIKLDIDKGNEINSNYFLTLHDRLLEEIPYTSITNYMQAEDKLYQTIEEIPTPLGNHTGSGIMYVSDVINNPIQWMPRGRRSFLSSRKYTPTDSTYYYEPNRVYVQAYTDLIAINIIGIWEDPTKVGLDADERYPIPLAIIPIIKQLILERELGIMLRMPSDDDNNSTLSDIKPQAVPKK